MECPGCSKTIAEGSRFCMHCGFLVSEAPGSKTVVEQIGGTTGGALEDFSEKTRFLSPVPPENKAESKGKPLFFAWFVSLGGGDTGKDYRILKEKTAIGKSEDSDIVIRTDFVSRNHALLSYEDRKFILNDLQSTNHTYVNDKKISRRILKDDDLVRFGDALYEFKCL
jgi:hypothetical protein